MTITFNELKSFMKFDAVDRVEFRVLPYPMSKKWFVELTLPPGIHRTGAGATVDSGVAIPMTTRRDSAVRQFSSLDAAVAAVERLVQIDRRLIAVNLRFA